MPPARLVPTSTPGIYRRGSRYAVRFTKPDGKPGQRSARTLAEARRLRAELTADVARGQCKSSLSRSPDHLRCLRQAVRRDLHGSHLGRHPAGRRRSMSTCAT